MLPPFSFACNEKDCGEEVCASSSGNTVNLFFDKKKKITPINVRVCLKPENGEANSSRVRGRLVELKVSS